MLLMKSPSTTSTPTSVGQLLELFSSYLQPEKTTATKTDDDPPLSPLDWALLYRRIDNKPLSLERYQPLQDIFNDRHPFKVIRKPAQKGASELAVTLACHMLDVGAKYHNLDKAGLNVGYVFSTDKALSFFSKERFSGLRRESPKLANLFTQYDAVQFKQAGDSYLYFAGGKSIASMKSFAADFLILDEYDEIDQNIVSLAEVRLNNSELGHELRLSTPTLPNVGIDALYQSSDQQVWEVMCGGCKEWNELDFFRDVRADGESWETWQSWEPERLREAQMHVACPSCKAEINTFGPGRWKALRPEVNGIRGYALPPLSCGVVKLNRLAVKAVSTDPTQITEFYRSDLGMPYTPKGSRITDTMMRLLSVELENGRLPAYSWHNVTMGVDVGAKYNYRISATGPDGKRYVIAMGVAGSYAELDQLMANYKVRRVVIDANPELNPCAEWALRHLGKVFRAYYPTSNALKTRMFRLPGEEPEEADVSDKQEAYTVNINRTMAMDAVYNAIATGTERWPAAIHNHAEISKQMQAPVRVLVKDKDGQEYARWEHTTPDDYYHASVYDLIAYLTLPKGIGGSGSLGLGKAKVKMA
jgi:hypothetical protein